MSFDVIAVVDALETAHWSGTAWRHTGAARDPLSGLGARLFGGRWNPKGVPTIYLASPVETCVGEFLRMAEGQGRGPESFPDREVHEIAVHDLEVIDLRPIQHQRELRLADEDITGDDRSQCQAVGEAAHYLGIQGVVAPSATGSSLVIAAFEDHAHHGELTRIRTSPLQPLLSSD